MLTIAELKTDFPCTFPSHAHTLTASQLLLSCTSKQQQQQLEGFVPVQILPKTQLRLPVTPQNCGYCW